MSVLDIVDEPGGDTLFAFHDPDGESNPFGVEVKIARDHELDMGSFAPEYVLVSGAVDGGTITHIRHGLTEIRFRMRVAASTLQPVIDCLGHAGYLLNEGGWLAFTPTDDADTVYIPFEPSPALQTFTAQRLVMLFADRTPVDIPDIDVRINRQPYALGNELTANDNKATNPTLTHDFGGTASRPDGWTWSSTTGLSAEIIDLDRSGGHRRGVYRFTMADGTAKSLQQMTAVASFAPADVGVFSFYARAVSGGTAKMRAGLEYFRSDGTTTVGGLQQGTLTTLTSAWQRVSVIGAAAGALTSRLQQSITIDNDDGTAVVVEVCNAQPETSPLSDFRVPEAAVAYNPASTSLPRKMAVWGGGNIDSPGELRVQSDALTLERANVYRVSDDRAVDVMNATLHKSLRSGSLGSNTASAVDTDAIDGNVAEVTYSEPDPAFGTDNGAGGASTTTIVITKPTSLAVGDCMVAHVSYHREDGQIIAPDGWSNLGTTILLSTAVGSGAEMVMWVWVKIADADDVAASSFTFEVAYGSGGSGAADYTAWIGRFTGVDTNDPVDAFAFAIETSVSSAPTLPSITTSADDAMIVGIVAGADDNQIGSLTFTAPAGSTPTYTEQDDRQSSSTWRGSSVVTGVLATAGATGTKDFTASLTGYWAMCHIALRKSPAVLAARSTVTYAGSGTGALPPGEYDVWLRYRTTAACFDRIRGEYAHEASPAAWIALGPDMILDTRNAATFTEYQERLLGRLFVPETIPLDTLSVRISSGREASSSAALRLDCVYLAPAFEWRSIIVSPTVLADDEYLLADAVSADVLHLATDGEQSEVAECHGPVPFTAVPGYQAVIIWTALDELVGFADPKTEVTAAPNVRVTHTPRLRA